MHDVIKDCSTILVWPLYYIFNYCFSNGVCPSVWLSSYLLPIYKGKGPLNEPDSYRGVALQCVVLKLYTYILNHRIGDWAETEGVLPEQQLLRCEWASCEQMNRDNIQQIVKVLHSCNMLT